VLKSFNDSLPRSPNKKIVVSQCVLQVLTQPVKKNANGATVSIRKETKSAVIAFYENDDVSRQAPGMRDSVTQITASGDEIRIQKVGICYF
jgi:hypothetical protein